MKRHHCVFFAHTSNLAPALRSRLTGGFDDPATAFYGCSFSFRLELWRMSNRGRHPLQPEPYKARIVDVLAGCEGGMRDEQVQKMRWCGEQQGHPLSAPTGRLSLAPRSCSLSGGLVSKPCSMSIRRLLNWVWSDERIHLR